MHPSWLIYRKKGIFRYLPKPLCCLDTAQILQHRIEISDEQKPSFILPFRTPPRHDSSNPLNVFLNQNIGMDKTEALYSIIYLYHLNSTKIFEIQWSKYYVRPLLTRACKPSSWTLAFAVLDSERHCICQLKYWDSVHIDEVPTESLHQKPFWDSSESWQSIRHICEPVFPLLWL